MTDSTIYERIAELHFLIDAHRGRIKRLEERMTSLLVVLENIARDIDSRLGLLESADHSREIARLHLAIHGADGVHARIDGLVKSIHRGHASDLAESMRSAAWSADAAHASEAEEQ